MIFTRIFPDNNRCAWFWFSLFLLALVYVGIQPYLLINAYKRKERICIVNGTEDQHSFHIVPVLGAEEAKELYIDLAALATSAMLNRNPSGIDNETLFNQIFLPGARSQILEYMKTDQRHFEAYAIHQKCESGKMHILKTADDQILVRSIGQIIRVGVVENRNFLQAFDFKIDFVLCRNPYLRKAGRLPYVVSRLTFETRERKRTEGG